MITLVLPIPPKALWPNSRRHWSQKAKAVRDYRNYAWAVAHVALQGRLAPWWKEAEATAVFYFKVARVRDRDNAAASLKAAWDGIADAGIVRDDCGLRHNPPEMRIDKLRPRVELTVTPI